MVSSKLPISQTCITWCQMFHAYHMVVNVSMMSNWSMFHAYQWSWKLVKCLQLHTVATPCMSKRSMSYTHNLSNVSNISQEWSGVVNFQYANFQQLKLQLADCPMSPRIHTKCVHACHMANFQLTNFHNINFQNVCVW